RFSRDWSSDVCSSDLCLAGVFRTLLTPDDTKVEGEFRGYHKPIMIAGGVGMVREKHALKKPEYVQEGAHVIVLGGPAMLIGLGEIGRASCRERVCISE